MKLSVQLLGPLKALCPGVRLEEVPEGLHHVGYGEAVADLVYHAKE